MTTTIKEPVTVPPSFTRTVNDLTLALQRELGFLDDSIHAKGGVCLAARNLWDEFLYALGEFDEDRHRIDYEYSDETRVRFAPLWFDMSMKVLKTLDAAVEGFKSLKVPVDDHYHNSVIEKLDLLKRAMQS